MADSFLKSMAIPGDTMELRRLRNDMLRVAALMEGAPPDTAGACGKLVQFRAQCRALQEQQREVFSRVVNNKTPPPTPR